MGAKNSFASQLGNTLQSTFLVSFFGFLFSILITRVLGPEKRGIFTLLMNLPSIIVTIGRFGFAHSVVYNINRSDKNEVIFTSFMVAFFGGTLLFLCTILTLGIIQFSFSENVNFLYFVLSALFIPLLFMSDVLYSLLQGLKEIHYRNFVYTVQSVIYLIAAVGALFFSIQNALPLFLFAGLVSYCVVISMIMLKIGFVKFINIGHFNIDTLKALFNYGLKSHFGNIFKQLSYRVDIIIIAFFLPARDLGLYAVAVTLSELIWKIPEAIGFVLLPRISESKNLNSFEITARISRLIMLPMLFICVVIFFFGDFFLQLLFGDEFIPAHRIVMYLLPGTFFFSLWKIYVNDLIARGKALIYSYSSLLSAAIIIALNIILLPKIGIIGASISSTLGYIVATLFVMWKFRGYSSINLREMIFINRADVVLLNNFRKTALDRVLK